MSDPGYTNRAGSAFVEILSIPGPYNLTITTSTGSVTRARREAEHQEKREAYHIQEACKTVTKNQLDLAILQWLMNEIEDCITGLKNVTIINIFDHAFDRKGHIDDNLVQQYHQAFRQPISVAEGIKAYIDKQEDCQRFFQDAKQPISDAQMVSQSQLHVTETGLFNKEYLTWIKRLWANKTWNDFKTYWMEKFGDYDLLRQLTSKEGALGAHAATAPKESNAYD